MNFTFDPKHWGDAVVQDLADTAPDYPAERQAQYDGLRRGLVGERFAARHRGIARLVETALGIGPDDVWPGGVYPQNIAEAARWAGWCRALKRAGYPPPLYGPRGGISGVSYNGVDYYTLETARRFGFVPGRLMAARTVALAEIRRLQVSFAWLGTHAFVACLRPSRRRTLRNVRRLAIRQRLARVERLMAA